jgi:hypothetical protein
LELFYDSYLNDKKVVGSVFVRFLRAQSGAEGKHSTSREARQSAKGYMKNWVY